MTITPPPENSIPGCRPRQRSDAAGLRRRDAWEPMSSTELGRLAGSKARVYRVLILWQQVERGAPQGDCTVRCTQYYDWEYYDQMFRRAAVRGVRLMPLLHGAPRWSGAPGPTYQPTTPRASARSRTSRTRRSSAPLRA